VSYGSVVNYLNRAKQAGLAWPLPDGMDERTLGRLLYPSQPATGQRPTDRAKAPFYRTRVVFQPTTIMVTAKIHGGGIRHLGDKVMTIEQLGSLGELIGAIAVLATLVYLSVQIRQAKDMFTIETRRNRGDRLVQFFGNEVKSPYLGPILQKMQDQHGYGLEQHALIEAYGLTKLDAIRWTAHLSTLWQPIILEYENLPEELRAREDDFIYSMARYPDQRIFLENLSTGTTLFSKRVGEILADIDSR
jgi:hypothetical protein